MSASLGEKLRQAREERGISIGEVAEQTRISSLYLKSIEDDNYKPLPGGIFNKGFVKAYAKYVGLDEQEALQDYARLIAQNEEQNNEEQQPRYRPEVLTDDRSTSSLVPTIIFAGIILALMTGGILFVVSYIQNQSDTPAVATNSGNTNGNAESNVESANVVATSPAVSDEIQLEFRSLAEKVSVTSTVDGTLAYDEITPDNPKTYTARQNIKLRYYRGFADKVQISLNGKQVAAPAPPPRGNIEFEVTKENFAQIIESGQLVAAGTPVTSTPSPQPTAAATSAATQSSPTPAPRTSPTRTPANPVRPAFTPQPVPRRSPTPIVVGRPPDARPSPN